MPAKELSRAVLCKKASTFDCDTIFGVSLANMNLATFPRILADCPNLITLDLCHNQLTRADALPPSALLQLRVLLLAHNHLESADTIGTFPALQELRLQGNRIHNVQSLRGLAYKLPALRALHLQHIDGTHANPVCRQPGYREAVLDMFPDLKVLDGQRIGGRHDIYALCRVLDTTHGHLRDPSSEPLAAERKAPSIGAPQEAAMERALAALTALHAREAHHKQWLASAPRLPPPTPVNHATSFLDRGMHTLEQTLADVEELQTRATVLLNQE